MEEFDNLKMEYAFMKAELLRKGTKETKPNSGNFTSNKLWRSFGRRLNPTKKMKSWTSYAWRRTREYCLIW
jgi:hypothetical protein